MIDIIKIRKEFPTLSEKVYGKPLIYFDNGASSLKTKSVIQSTSDFYAKEYSNIHRGVHFLSQNATQAYEDSRKKIQKYLNAKYDHEIIFTKGTTDSINTIAHSFCKKHLKPGDEILISYLEHHSNIVPWQMACEQYQATLKVIPMLPNGELDQIAYQKLISEKTKIISIGHISNALGTINPVKEMIALAHKNNIPVLIDGAQAVQHFKIDLQDLDADFYVFSGHKMFAPTGIGVLYGKEKWLNDLPPYQGGGDMIKTVSFEKTTYNELPHKFEAGTPNIAGVIAFGKAIDFLESLDMPAIQKHEKELLDYATTKIKKIGNIKIYGEAKHKASVISFIPDNCHPYDIGAILDQQGVAVRTGNHCAQPIMDWYKIPGTVRASFALYNNKEEVDVFIKALSKAIKMLS